MCIKVRKKHVHLVPEVFGAVSKTSQSHPSSPSALPQAENTMENTIEATATALNELGKGVAILGTTWECGPSAAARAKTLVMSPHQRRDTKNQLREREREKKTSINLFIYLFICLSVYLSVCQRNQMHLFDIEHRIMYGYVSNRIPTPTQTWASY